MDNRTIYVLWKLMTTKHLLEFLKRNMLVGSRTNDVYYKVIWSRTLIFGDIYA